MNLSNLDIENILNKITGFLPRLGLALLILFIAYWVSRIVRKQVRRAMKRRDHDPELIVLLEMLTRWGILAFGIVIAAEQIAPGQFSSLIAGLGVAGITVGFALQDVAKNFIAGLLLLIQQPFEIGDSIEVVSYGGTVLEISLRSTTIRTWDGRHVIIPNSEVYLNPIINFSAAPRRRIEITVGVAPDSDLDQVTRVALKTLTENVEGILQDPAPQIIFSNFGDFTIDFTAYYWIDTGEVGVFKATNEGVKAIKNAFDEEKIEMPYPTYVTLTDKG
jgi:small conductance mechanosensitive channel